MNNLKAFFYIYKKSATSALYYKEVLDSKSKLTFKYFLMLSLALTLIWGTKAPVVLLPEVVKSVNEFTKAVKNSFEPDLVINFQDNKWAINKPEPYLIPLTLIGEKERTDLQLPKNFIVLSHTGTIDDMDRFDTLILVNSKNIISKGEGQIKVTPIENLPNAQITKTDFDGFITQAANTFNNFRATLVFLAYVGIFLYFFVIKGSNLFMTAFFVWLFSKFLSFKPNYKQSIKISAHTATIPLTLLVVTKLLGSKFDPNIFMWSEMLNFVIAMGVVYKLSKNQSTQSVGQVDDKAASIEA
jgi:hypothetical protein